MTTKAAVHQEEKCAKCKSVVLYALFAEALGFCALKLILGFVCGSRALTVSSLYSLQDLVASIAAAIGMRVSARPPDRHHPYGHGKVEFLVVGLMSVVLLLGVLAFAVIVLEGFLNGATSEPKLLALLVALVCGTSCWILSRHSECVGTRFHLPSLLSCSEHMWSDFLSSIAVVVSVLGARMGYSSLDHIIAVLEAVHIVYVSGRMLGTAVNGLMDSSADAPLIETLIQGVKEEKSVVRVAGAKARWSGQTLMTEFRVEVPGQIKVAEAEGLRARIGSMVKKRAGANSSTLVLISPVTSSPVDS